MLDKEYNSTFKCARGIPWTIRFKTSSVLRFCGEHKKRIEDLLPHSLNEEELIKLSYIGVEHHGDIKGVTWDMWLDDHLVGEVYDKAREATLYGILNFILPRLPEKMRVMLKHTLKDLLKTDEPSTQDAVENGGAGPTSLDSV